MVNQMRFFGFSCHCNYLVLLKFFDVGLSALWLAASVVKIHQPYYMGAIGPV
jgi:hypothetical protein